MSAIKDIYKYLRDNYNRREKWSFGHEFVYFLTFGLGIASLVVLIVAAFALLGCLIEKSMEWFIPAIVAVVAGILTVLSRSLLAWINHN